MTNNTPSVNPEPSVLIVSGETEARKPLEDMYNLGLTHAAEAVAFAKGSNPLSDMILDAVINAINSLKQPHP